MPQVMDFSRAPEDPAYYDRIAEGSNWGMASQIAEGAVAGVVAPFAMREKAEMARALYNAFMAQGMKEPSAAALALKYLQTGDVANMQKVLMDIQKSTADVGKTIVDTETSRAALPFVGREKEAGIGATEAKAFSDKATGEAATKDSGTRAFQAGIASRAQLSADKKAERDYALEFDTDRSGEISNKEKFDWLKAERVKLRQEQKKDEEKSKEGGFREKFSPLPEAEFDAEVLRRVNEQIADYEWSGRNMKNVGNPDAGSDTKKAIEMLKGKSLRPDLTVEQISAAVLQDFPQADIEEVLKAITGF